MRAFLGLMALIAAGCAGQPSQPQANTAAPVAAVPAASAAAPGAKPAAPAPTTAPADIETQRLAKAKNLNLKIVNKDGQELYCRSNFVTASRIQRDETCYTKEQLDQIDRLNQRQFDQFLSAPNIQSPPSFSK